LSDETPQDEAPEETPAEETPQEDAPAEEPATDIDPAEEASQEDPVPGDTGDAPAEDAAEAPSDATEEPATEASETEPAAEEPPAEAPEAEAAEEPVAEAPADPRREPKPKAEKADIVPGAELEPIQLESDDGLDAEERARREAEEEERLRLESALTEDEPEDTPVARPVAKIAKDARYGATGKRKRSVARVLLESGDGQISINGRTLIEYFPRHAHQTLVRQPLVTAGYTDNVNVRIRVHGGGVSGQASASRHGIARALTEIDAELRPELKRRGLLTRDARIKERRKAGLKKARKRPQFSKR